MKKCSKCQENKEFSCFYKGRAECKTCSEKYRESNTEKIKNQKKEYYLKNKEYILNRCKNYEKENKQKCIETDKKYRLKNAQKIKEYHKLYHIKNKKIIKEKGQNYYKVNKVKIAEKHKRNRLKNGKNWKKTPYKPEKQKEYTNKYLNKHKDRIIKRRKERRKYKYYNDINYFLKSRLRNSICNAIKNNYGTKDNQTESYLGCSFQNTKIYIESKFTDGMTWDNYGGRRYTNGIKNKIWELDHIKPLALFDLSSEEERKIAFNYKNLAPKWWWDNALKSDLFYGINAKKIPEAIIKHESLLKMANELSEI